MMGHMQAPLLAQGAVHVAMYRHRLQELLLNNTRCLCCRLQYTCGLIGVITSQSQPPSWFSVNVLAQC